MEKKKEYSAIYNTDGGKMKLKKIKDSNDINVVQNFIKGLETRIMNKNEN